MTVKKTDATSLKRRDEAISLVERYSDYMLMDALDGTFQPSMDYNAAAAFSMTDLETLRDLCDQRKCPIDFVEPDEALKHYPKPKNEKGVERDFSMAERAAILANHDGTRLYARRLYVEQAGSPFDA